MNYPRAIRFEVWSDASLDTFFFEIVIYKEDF